GAAWPGRQPLPVHGLPEHRQRGACSVERHGAGIGSGRMIPAAFDYRAPTSLQEAISILEANEDEAKILAGGHSLLPLMKLRLAAPGLLVDLGRIPNLSYIEDRGDHIAIGAMTPH